MLLLLFSPAVTAAVAVAYPKNVPTSAYHEIISKR